MADLPTEKRTLSIADAVLSADFLDHLIKRSTDAELILMDCGRLRLQRAALAAVELYLEQFPLGGN